MEMGKIIGASLRKSCGQLLARKCDEKERAFKKQRVPAK
uniref:Uncharacterized protein n=1 Tax=Anguilla anguilla TaxID=7936 RepID=A0A0E9Q5L1_ANGAN